MAAMICQVENCERVALEATGVCLRHAPRVGVRQTTVCDVKDCTWRSFDVGARCPTHDRAVVQANRPYFGQSTV